MKTVNNSSETASPRGGVGSIVMRTQSTATKVNTIRRPAWTSLRVSGEVRRNTVHYALYNETFCPGHGGSYDTLGVVGGSRLRKGSAGEDGRPEQGVHWRQCRSGVRAAVVAGKPGNSGGAKGGRKADSAEGEGIKLSRIDGLQRIESGRPKSLFLEPETECGSPRKEALGGGSRTSPKAVTPSS